MIKKNHYGVIYILGMSTSKIILIKKKKMIGII